MKGDDDLLDQSRFTAAELVSLNGMSSLSASRKRAASKHQRRTRRLVVVPWKWKERLAKAQHVVTYKLALELLFETWRTGERSVAVSNAMAKRAGISPTSKRRAIAELEGLGLLRVTRDGFHALQVRISNRP